MKSSLALADRPIVVTFPITLNDHWRVVDDPLQWILEVRKGQAGKKSTGYRARSFCASRTGLTQCIRDNCGDLYPGTLARIDLLPDLHQDW